MDIDQAEEEEEVLQSFVTDRAKAFQSADDGVLNISEDEAMATASEAGTPRQSQLGIGGDPTTAQGAVPGQQSQAEHQHGEAEREREELREPSWVECYHELHDELWIPHQDVHNRAPTPAEWLQGTSGPGRPSPAEWPSLVLLGNFETSAVQVPSTGRLVVSLKAKVPMALHTEVEELSAIPAVWNPRFADRVVGNLVADLKNEIGGADWHSGKDGALVMIHRSMIQKSPLTPDWASAVWCCADAGARATIVINDLPDDGPGQPAFRMGLFGSPPPPIPAFMISGQEALLLKKHISRQNGGPVWVTVESLRSPNKPLVQVAPSAPRAAELPASEINPPPWPLVLRALQDVAQAWSLVETVYRASPFPELGEALAVLAQRMGLPEKRVWLTRRLQRCHRGDTHTDEPAESPLAFVECNRSGDQLPQLRTQLAEKTGLAAPDITGEFEVRFVDESSVGSAVVREWMDHVAQQAFLLPRNRLLISYDKGVTFLPDPAAPFINLQWQGDFEMLGRLLGLALWHQVTLDLPVHPHICEMLMMEQEPVVSSLQEDLDRFAEIDEETCKHKVQWLLSNQLTDLGFEMPFTDVLIDQSSIPATSTQSQQEARLSCSAACASVEMEVELPGFGTSSSSSGGSSGSTAPPLPSVVSPTACLPGNEKVGGPWLRPYGHTEVELVSHGRSKILTGSNKPEYVSAMLDWRLRRSLAGPVAAMRRGLRAVVPSTVLAEARRMLSPNEVHSLLAGSRAIESDDWERNTRTVGGLTSQSQEVRWFWQTVHQWAAEGRQDRLQDLLQFATGSRRVPVGGFAQLVGFNGGKHLFTLAKGSHLTPQSLPTSHACICTVDLPPWETFEAAQRKLLGATEAGRCRFDESSVRGAASAQ